MPICTFFDPEYYMVDRVTDTRTVDNTVYYDIRPKDANGIYIAIEESRVEELIKYLKQSNEAEFVTYKAGQHYIMFSHHDNTKDTHEQIGRIDGLRHLLVVGHGPVFHRSDDYRWLAKLMQGLYNTCIVTSVRDSISDEEKYNPKNYILQPDYEDVSFSVFTKSEFEESCGDEGFRLAVSEEGYDRLMRLFGPDGSGVSGLEFQLENEKYGTGTLIVSTKTEDSMVRITIPCDGFHDFAGASKIEDPSKLTLIYNLLKELYDEEFPEKTSDPVKVYRDQFEYQRDACIKKMNTLKEDLAWLCGRYGENWGEESKRNYQGVINMINESIKEEESKNGQK